MLLHSFYCIIISFGFSILFNMRGRNLFLAALGGGISWFVYLLCMKYIKSTSSSLFFASVSVGIYAEIMARIFKSPVTSFTISGIIPLVPGNGMYYTMHQSISGNVQKAITTGLQTFTSAGAIAIAIVMVSSITRLVTFKKRRVSP